jgi:hypothetical protein
LKRVKETPEFAENVTVFRLQFHERPEAGYHLRLAVSGQANGVDFLGQAKQAYKLESIRMRRIQYPKSADEAYRDLVRAVKQIGVVESSSQLTRTVTGSVVVGDGALGAYYTTLQASVIEAESRTLLEVEAVSGTDSVPRPEAISLLLKALDNPKFKNEQGCLGPFLLLAVLGGGLLLFYHFLHSL